MPKTTRPINSITLAAVILLPVVVTALAFVAYEVTTYPNGYWHHSSVADAATYGAVWGIISGIAPSSLVTAIYLLNSVRNTGTISKSFLRTALLSFFIPFFIIAATYFAQAYSGLQEIHYGGREYTSADYVRELLLSLVFGVVAGLVVLNVWMLRWFSRQEKLIE